MPLKRLSQTVGRWATIHSFTKSHFNINTMCAGRVRPFPRNRRISIVSIIFPPPQKIQYYYSEDSVLTFQSYR